jgi:hypothetical protein
VFSTKIKALALAVGVAAPLLAAVPANAALADQVVTATVKYHADNGHGSPAHWADDTFVRTMKIHKTSAHHYTVTTNDVGTFTTRKNAGSPNNDVTISRKLTGPYTSQSVGHITGDLKASAVLHLSGKTYYGNQFSSNAWANQFFKTGATGNAFNAAYKFTYKTLDEQWVDASWNHDGTDASAGDITGKLSSKLVANFVCKSATQAKWTVKNVQGDRSRPFTYWVWVYPGHWTVAAHGAVAAGGTATIVTQTGTTLAAHYYSGYSVLEKTYAHRGTATC